MPSSLCERYKLWETAYMIKALPNTIAVQCRIFTMLPYLFNTFLIFFIPKAVIDIMFQYYLSLFFLSSLLDFCIIYFFIIALKLSYSQESAFVNYYHLSFAHFSDIILHIASFYRLRKISNILRQITSKISTIFSFRFSKSLLYDINTSIPPF